MGKIRNVGELVEPSHDEGHRQRFISILRKKVLMDFARDMKTVYEQKVEPRFEHVNRRKPRDGREIRRAMRHEPIYEAWSSLRYNAQFMTWWSVQPAVERSLPTLIEAARDAARQSPAGGSLEIDRNLAIPGYVTQLDVHQMPGCFHSEYAKDDVAQGAIYHYGANVFYGGLGSNLKPKGDVARSIAHYLKARFPKFQPKRILDMGCTAGSNTLPYKELFPNAEVHGIDVGAPCLRFGHALAEAQGLAVHFHQRSAEAPGFPDNHFDLITSSFFFHEVSVPATQRILKECYRMLKPGGAMIHMELPPTALTDAYQNFYYDWDALYNNEPHYERFRAMDFPRALMAAGFKRDKLHLVRIPNYASTPREEFLATARGTNTKRREHGVGRVWFTFGGWK
ncbi:MAG: class I SAM-dependent methyltransferase [Alphaproteobacteria bacterium]|nr:class I SAM-dependent methyltransferase [Alphaproteobacteria bacterium]